MSDLPRILTAIPRRRYRIGEFGVTLLAEVESGDGIDYQFIMAFVEEGQSRPSLYVCGERNPPGQRSEGSHRLRMVNQAMSEILGSDDAWRDLEAFAEQALAIGAKALGLGREQPVQLS
jgi:hypothetical protein